VGEESGDKAILVGVGVGGPRSGEGVGSFEVAAGGVEEIKGAFSVEVDEVASSVVVGGVGGVTSWLNGLGLTG
jgi:hypothetical protein